MAVIVQIFFRMSSQSSQSSPATPPLHCQLRGAVSGIRTVKEELHMRVAAMATYALEGSVERVVTAGRTIRAYLLDRDLASIEKKVESTISDSNKLYTKYTEAITLNAKLQTEVDGLHLRLKALEKAAEVSFPQSSALIESQEIKALEDAELSFNQCFNTLVDAQDEQEGREATGTDEEKKDIVTDSQMVTVVADSQIATDN